MDLRGSGAGLFEMRSRSCMRVDSVLGREFAFESIITSVRSLVFARVDRVIGAEIFLWGTAVSAGTNVT